MDLSQLGGGGGFRPTFFSGALQIAAGVTGTILTITAPAGKKVRLMGLAATPGQTENNISISAQGSTVVNSLSLRSTSTNGTGEFCVNQLTSNGGVSGALLYVESDTSITVSKSGGNTTNVIYYAYAYGEK